MNFETINEMDFETIKVNFLQRVGRSKEERAAKAAAAQAARDEARAQRKARALSRYADTLSSVKWSDSGILDWLREQCAKLESIRDLRDFETAFFTLVEKPHVVKDLNDFYGWVYDDGTTVMQLYQAQRIFRERANAIRPAADEKSFYEMAKMADEAWAIHEAGDNY